MAEEPQEVRRINGREVCGFTHIFGSFRLSRHMPKLVIALAAVLLTWGAGLVLDLGFTHFSAVYAVHQAGRAGYATPPPSKSSTGSPKKPPTRAMRLSRRPKKRRTTRSSRS